MWLILDAIVPKHTSFCGHDLSVLSRALLTTHDVTTPAIMLRAHGTPNHIAAPPTITPFKFTVRVDQHTGGRLG